MIPLRLREPAPAKVNLFLHALAKRPDGYHELESLVVFAELGDVVELEVTPASARAQESQSVIVSGPFAEALEEALGPGGVLSVETAYEIARRAARPRRFEVGLTLTKNLPVAAGVGGGSADAAATLRGLARAFELGWSVAETAEAAVEIGADAPACVHARALVMRGRGERIAPLEAWPDLDAVLVNPGRPVSTPAVFAARTGGFGAAHPPPPATRDRREAIGYLAGARNDLTEAAVALEPAIAEVLDHLRGLEGARLARLSGSGATCWALFDDPEEAARAAESIRAERPGWWTAATRLMGAA